MSEYESDNSYDLTIEHEAIVSSIDSSSAQSLKSTSAVMVEEKPTSLILNQQDILKLDDYIRHLASITNELVVGNAGLIASDSGNILSFTKGFLLGQFSVIIVLVAFIRFFVFSESIPKNSPGGKKKRLITNDTILNGNEFAIAAVAAAAAASSSKKGVVSSMANDFVGTSNDPASSTSAAATLGSTNSTTAGSASISTVRSTSDPNDMTLLNDEDNLAIVNTINTILEKTYYNVNTHQTESLDWFNVLVAQIITQFRTEALYENNILNSLNEFMSSASENSKIPDWLDTIKINEINIGNDFPIFSNCRITKNKLGKLEAKIDVDLSDTLTLAIETKILINKPKILTAALPIKLSVSIVRFSGCLNILLDSVPVLEDTNEALDEATSKTANSESNNRSSSNSGNTDKENGFEDHANNEDDVKNKKTNDSNTGQDTNGSNSDTRPLKFKGVLNFGFSSDYRLEFKTESLIGSRSKLENVPKISSLIESQLKSWFVERCVEPRFQLIPLPNMWPRKKNVRANI